MRTWLSLAVIALSLGALVSGYVSGRSSAAPPVNAPVNALAAAIDARVDAPVTFARSLHGAHSFTAAELAPPSDEDAVVSNSSASGRLAEDATVALVIVNAGPSLKLESGFLNLEIPMTVAIDPSADESSQVAAAAFERGKSVYVQLPVSASQTVKSVRSQIQKFRSTFPSMTGLAIRFDDQIQEREATVVAQALRDQHLRLLDLTGVDAQAAAAFRSAGIASRRRDVTIDNRDEPAYVNFMLSEAVQVARGRGSAVIVAHPYPGSLSALSALVGNRNRDGVNFTIL